MLDRLDELVVEPVAESGGSGMLIGPHASGSEIEGMRRRVAADPRGFIAQEVVSLSRHPTLIDDAMAGRHVDLRPFAISGETVEGVPGGLTRVAPYATGAVGPSGPSGNDRSADVIRTEVVERFASRVEADLARSLLVEHGIEARVTADDAGGLHPELSLVTGGVAVLVAPDDLDTARELLGPDTSPEPRERGRTSGRRRSAVAVVAVAVVVLLVTMADAVTRGGLLPL